MDGMKGCTELLKQETALPPRSSLPAQQRAFNDFMYEYNYERPHEALGDLFPYQLYEYSKREFPEKIPDVAYPTNIEVFEVSNMRTIRDGKFMVFLAPALIGERIGLEEISDRHMRIHFCSAAIGVLDKYTGKILKYKNPLSIIYFDKTGGIHDMENHLRSPLWPSCDMFYKKESKERKGV